MSIFYGWVNKEVPVLHILACAANQHLALERIEQVREEHKIEEPICLIHDDSPDLITRIQRYYGTTFEDKHDFLIVLPDSSHMELDTTFKKAFKQVSKAA